MSLENFIITVYCLIEDGLKKLGEVGKLRQRGFSPSLSDGEVITIEIVAEFLGIDTDKGAWEYIRDHWLEWFPMLGSRANFAKHATHLWQAKQWLQRKLAQQLGAFVDELRLADGFPMPVCQFKRAHFSRVFKGVATYGYCASKGEKYYGFKGNLLINSEGIISNITVTAANVDERDSLWDIVDEIKGMVIADKGFIGAEYQAELRQFTGINLQTAVRSNMKETRKNKFHLFRNSCLYAKQFN